MLDNCIVDSTSWCSVSDVLQQTSEYCGVIVHHHCGIAERQIHTIADWAHTMLLHVMHKWPDVETIDLWLYTLKLAADLHNVTPILLLDYLQQRSLPRQKTKTGFLTFTLLVVLLLF
jgi:hypothetical protein